MHKHAKNSHGSEVRLGIVGSQRQLRLDLELSVVVGSSWLRLPG